MLEALNSATSSGDWVDVPENNVVFSSLLGIPVSGIPMDRNSSFSLHSYYHNIQCHSIKPLNASGDWLTPLHIPSARGHNTTSIWGTRHNSFFLGTYTDTSAARLNRTDTSPVELILLSRSGSNETGTNTLTNITVAECSHTPTFVETNVQCQQRDCRVDKIRSSTIDGAVYTVPLMQGFTSIFALYASSLAGATAVTNIYSTPTENYLYGQTAFPFAHGLELVSLYNVSKSDMSIRLAQ